MTRADDGYARVKWQEFWLARPIDMNLARTRRLNRSLADQAMAAKRVQAFLRRAIDPVGPCIHLARKLIPILQRNAAVRGYLDFCDGTYAVRTLQAAVRRCKKERPYLQQLNSAVDLERWVRALLSLRQYEESLSRADRAAVAAMSAHGDPSGWGIWERVADGSLWSIPTLLQRTGQFESLQRTLSIAFLSRVIEARGVHDALIILRFARGVTEKQKDGQKERERERERQTDRQTDRQRQTETEIETETETETEIDWQCLTCCSLRSCRWDGILMS